MPRLHAQKPKKTPSPSPLVYQRSDQTAPACLVRSADACAVVSVKVLIEQNVVAPVRVVLKFLRPAVDRTSAFLVPREDSNQTIGYLSRHFGQSYLAARSIGERHAEVRPISLS